MKYFHCRLQIAPEGLLLKVTPLGVAEFALVVRPSNLQCAMFNMQF